MSKVIDYILAAFAVFRLAQFLPYDNGPRFIFRQIRDYTEKKKYEENEELGLWSNAHEVITCTYCQSFYASILVLIMLRFKLNFIIDIFALMGIQTWLQMRKFKQ